MARKKGRQGITGIEPHEMTLPAMDRPSVAFAWFLDQFRMAWDGPTDGVNMTCTFCGTVVCSVEAGDTLRVLLNTALAHTC